MGSLMAGWDSPVLDPEVAKYQRNKSFTKEEIEAFWKSRQKEEGQQSSPQQQQQQHVSTLRQGSHQEPARRYMRSASMPVPGRRSMLADDDDHHKVKVAGSEEQKTEEKQKTTTNCWWTRSKWAFLNEPPVMETEVSPRQRKYASFYCGHNVGSQKLGSHQQITT